MARIVRFFAERHLLVNLLVALACLLGVFAALSISREYVPPTALPTAFVTARLPGASAAEIENDLTIPIEEAVETLDGVDGYHSVVTQNASVTTVEFHLDLSDQQIAERMQALRDVIDAITEFPADLEYQPTIEQLAPAKWPIVEVALSGPQALVRREARRLERLLGRLSSVSRATVVGLQDPELRVLVDPQLAAQHEATILDVVEAIRARNRSVTSGMFAEAGHRRQVVANGLYRGAGDVADTVIGASSSGIVVRVRDVARLELGQEDATLIAHTDGTRGVSVVVRKRENADALDAMRDIVTALDNADLDPAVSYRLVNDRSFYTANRLKVLANNAVLGAVLVLLVLFLFLGPQAAGWVLVGIPVVFLASIAALHGWGLSLNFMTLTGLIIVLGMVVDDAVVVAENIVAQGERGAERLRAAVDGATQVAWPVLAAAATTLLAFAPMLAIGGLSGKVSWQLPVVVMLALSFSLLESFCVLPAHMMLGLRRQPRREFLRRLEARYGVVLGWVVEKRRLVIACAFLFLALVLGGVAPRLSFVLLPQDQARLLFIKITAPVGTPIERTEAIVFDLERQVQRIAAADLRAVTARIGHQDIERADKTYGEAEHEALLTVVLEDMDRTRTNQEWISHLSEALVTSDDVRLSLSSEYVGPPTDQPVTLHILANDDAMRRAVSADVVAFLSQVPGLSQIELDEQPGAPQLDLRLNYHRIAQLNLSADAVHQTLQASFYGVKATELRALEESTEVRVQFAVGAKADLQGLLAAPVRDRQGRLVRLVDVVDPLEVPGAGRIYHRQGVRAATVRAGFAPGSEHTALSFATRLRQELLPRINGTPGVEVLIGGEAALTEETTSDLTFVALLSVVGIFMVIWVFTGSLGETLIVLMTVPFAVAGVVLTFAIHQQPLSMYGLIGAIGLIGVVVNAAIVMLNAVHLESGRSGAGWQTFSTAVSGRLRPILVTSLTTLGGVLPSAYGLGGYDGLVAPMSLALGWGLLCSVGVTLLLLPALYASVYQRRHGLS